MCSSALCSGRKATCTCLFLKLPSGVVTPIEYKPMEVDAINRVTDGREERKRVTFDLRKPTL